MCASIGRTGLLAPGCPLTTLSPLGCDAACTIHGDAGHQFGNRWVGLVFLSRFGHNVSKLGSLFGDRNEHQPTVSKVSQFRHVPIASFGSSLVLGPESSVFWLRMTTGSFLFVKRGSPKPSLCSFSGAQSSRWNVDLNCLKGVGQVH